MNIEAKTKLSEKPISWKEAYTPRTDRIKRQFEDVVGSGSYFRFEGTDSDSGDEYFVVVGPAKIHAPKAMFFAGVRKLPSDFAAGGQYFPEMREAAEYATATWGVNFPSDITYYDASDLKDIRKKVEKWRKEHKDEKNDEENDEMSKAASSENLICIASSSYPYYELMTKEALAERLKKREGFYWFDIDDLLTASDDRFERMKETEPSLEDAKKEAINERANRRQLIARVYGEEAGSNFYKTWLAHKPGGGTYIVSVGPYAPKTLPLRDAVDKFSGFTKKLNVQSQEEIDEKIHGLMQEYADRYGVQLDRSDISVDLENKPFVGEIAIGKTGKEKIYNSPQWKSEVEDYYKAKGYEIPTERGRISKLTEAYKEESRIWATQLEEAYARSQEEGEAFKNQQPPPPKVGLTKRMYGQQFPTSIYKAPSSQMTGMSESEKTLTFGFDSIREAVEHITAESIPGAPIGEVPETTSEDLRAARQAVMEREGLAAEDVSYRTPRTRKPSEESAIPATAPKSTAPKATAPKAPKAPKVQNPSPSQSTEDIVAKPGKEEIKGTEVPEIDIPSMEMEPAVENAEPPHAEPRGGSSGYVAPEDFVSLPDVDIDDIDLEELLGKHSCVEETMINLVKTAESLDGKGRHDEAEEIHKIIRKHMGRIQ